MSKTEFDSEKLTQYWIESSDEDFETMLAMFETKRYNWTLFIGHLLVENF